MKPTICHIAFSPLAQLSPVLNELESLAACEYGISVVLPDYCNDKEYLRRRFPSVAFHFFRVRSRAFLKGSDAFSKALRYFEIVLNAFRCALSVNAHLYVAHNLTAMPVAVPASIIRRTPYIYRAHEMFSESNRETAPLMRLWHLLERCAVTNTRYIVTPELCRSEVYKHEYGARTLPAVVRNIPVVRDPYAKSQALREMLHLGQETMIVLYQGLIAPSRCLAELIEAVRLLPHHYHLTIIGSDPERYIESLTGAIADGSDRSRIHSLPFIPQESIGAITSSADIGCLLYRKDNRNNLYAAPNKLYEYLFAGLPVVVSDSPTLAPFVREYCAGTAADPTNPAAIAKAVQDTTAIERGAPLAKRMRALFSWQSEFRKLLNVYEEALGTQQAVHERG